MSFKGAVPLIAIVDDDESVRGALDSLVRSAGYRSVTFESGAAFLDSDRKQEIDCLILDIDMPGLNGLDVQRRLAGMNHSVPIIFVTGHEGKLQETALKQGAFALMGKGSIGRVLLESIELALKSSGC
jgi:FixJ family two-component response regulator